MPLSNDWFEQLLGDEMKETPKPKYKWHKTVDGLKNKTNHQSSHDIHHDLMESEINRLENELALRDVEIYRLRNKMDSLAREVNIFTNDVREMLSRKAEEIVFKEFELMKKREAERSRGTSPKPGEIIYKKHFDKIKWEEY